MKILTKITFCILLLILSISSLAGWTPPSVSIAVALAGLAFPLIWVVTAFVFIIMLLFRTRVLTLLGIVLLIITLPIVTRYFSLNLKNDKPGNSYKLFNFNTYGLRIPDIESRQLDCQDTLNDFLKTDKYSIACFQEYPMKGARHGKFYDKLMNGLPLRYKALSEYNYEEKSTQYILVTASEFPFIEQQVFKYEGNSFAMLTDIRFPDKIVRVYNVHLMSVKLTSEKRLLVYDKKSNISDLIIQTREAVRKLKTAFIHRENQLKILKSSIDESPYPVIIAGDFNDTPVSYTYTQLKAGMKDASSKAVNALKRTYKHSTFPLQIDYVLHDKEISCSGFRRVELDISDHYAISTVFSTR